MQVMECFMLVDIKRGTKSMQLLGIEMPFEEFDRLMCEQAQGKILVVEDGKVVAKEYEPTSEEIAALRIIELKQLLADSDYKAIKYAEGELTAEEYEPIKQQRREWREEIRSLEKSS